MDLKTKESLFLQLKERLLAEFQTLSDAHRITQEGATHEEAKPENDKDTRALEQSYLARGQAARVLTLEADVAILQRLVVRKFTSGDKITLGALVRVEDDEAERLYLLAPAGAGEELEDGPRTIKVVTPRSPLGKALQGAELEDDIQVKSPTGIRILTILAVD